jgi:hypothetical protein
VTTHWRKLCGSKKDLIVCRLCDRNPVYHTAAKENPNQQWDRPLRDATTCQSYVTRRDVR